MRYYQAFISTETKENAYKILDALLPQKLIFGGPVWDGPAKFWWKGEIVQMDYAFLFTYTWEDLREKLIEEAEKASDEDVCMISFSPLDSNDALIHLLDATFSQ